MLGIDDARINGGQLMPAVAVTQVYLRQLPQQSPYFTMMLRACGI
jgi:hypothetical protein